MGELRVHPDLRDPRSYPKTDPKATDALRDATNSPIRWRHRSPTLVEYTGCWTRAYDAVARRVRSVEVQDCRIPGETEKDRAADLPAPCSTTSSYRTVIISSGSTASSAS